MCIVEMTQVSGIRVPVLFIDSSLAYICSRLLSIFKQDLVTCVRKQKSDCSVLSSCVLGSYSSSYNAIMISFHSLFLRIWLPFRLVLLI